jgi:cytochrome c biogenesis protein ResB
VFANIDIRSSAFQQHVWLATGGAMLVLLQSILSGTRRVWWRLLMSCVIGGGGSALAGMIFTDSKFVYFDLRRRRDHVREHHLRPVQGSEEFKESPIEVFSQALASGHADLRQGSR